MKKEGKKNIELKGKEAVGAEEGMNTQHMKVFFVGAAATLIVIAGIAGMARFVSSDTKAADEQAQPTPVAVGPQESLPGNYHAVFLTNGQVYFGSVTKRGADEIVLEQIYYLQSDKQSVTHRLENQKELKLIKLGNELHGPEDMMYINRDHVLFIEPLKPDSKVVKAISEYTIK
ncbi:hypothetical protein GF391_00100 [Candidatus Uhrbacteria bacterium]|nr:hypothetical protein [Candidatus Uhrbacteria bacterium]